jgi:hypothetical protein
MKWHVSGMIQEGDLSIDTLKSVGDSGLDEDEVLQLLASFGDQVALQQHREGQKPGWKNAVLMEAVRAKVMRCV